MKSRKAPHFSLRGVFVLLSALSAPLAWIGCRADEARRREIAFHQIESLGGTVYVRGAVRNEAKSFAAALFEKEFEVGFARKDLSDGDLRTLGPYTGELHGVRELGLSGTKITDQGIASLEGFGGLQILYLSDTGVGDAGLAHLPSLPCLESLLLDGTAVTDEGLIHLAACPKLRLVNLYHTNVTDNGVERLRALRPDLRIGSPREGLRWTEPLPGSYSND